MYTYIHCFWQNSGFGSGFTSGITRDAGTGRGLEPPEESSEVPRESEAGAMRASTSYSSTSFQHGPLVDVLALVRERDRTTNRERALKEREGGMEPPEESSEVPRAGAMTLFAADPSGFCHSVLPC